MKSSEECHFPTNRTVSPFIFGPPLLVRESIERLQGFLICKSLFTGSQICSSGSGANDAAFDRILRELDSDLNALSPSTHLRLLMDAAYDPGNTAERLLKLIKLQLRGIQQTPQASVPSLFAAGNILRVFSDNNVSSELIVAMYPSISWAHSEDWNQRYLQENLLFYVVRAGLPSANEKGKAVAKDFAKKCVEGKSRQEEVDIYCNDIPIGVRQAAYCAALRPAGKTLDPKVALLPPLSQEDQQLRQQLTLYWNRVEAQASSHYLWDEVYPPPLRLQSLRPASTGGERDCKRRDGIIQSEGDAGEVAVPLDVEGFELAKLVTKWTKGREPGNTDIFDHPEF